ncbi:hypothetical protein JHK87_038525 [Glycine soja]|nr:hypothetical protein JHK87_038525 [Glycine soja]
MQDNQDVFQFTSIKLIDCGGKDISATITVGRQGNFTFGSIQAAIDSIKTNNDRWIKIHIEAGLYM